MGSISPLGPARRHVGLVCLPSGERSVLRTRLLDQHMGKACCLEHAAHLLWPTEIAACDAAACDREHATMADIEASGLAPEEYVDKLAPVAKKPKLEPEDDVAAEVETPDDEDDDGGGGCGGGGGGEDDRGRLRRKRGKQGSRNDGRPGSRAGGGGEGGGGGGGGGRGTSHAKRSADAADVAVAANEHGAAEEGAAAVAQAEEEEARQDARPEEEAAEAAEAAVAVDAIPDAGRGVVPRGGATAAARALHGLEPWAQTLVTDIARAPRVWEVGALGLAGGAPGTLFTGGGAVTGVEVPDGVPPALAALITVASRTAPGFRPGGGDVPAQRPGVLGNPVDISHVLLRLRRERAGEREGGRMVLQAVVTAAVLAYADYLALSRASLAGGGEGALPVGASDVAAIAAERGLGCLVPVRGRALRLICACDATCHAWVLRRAVLHLAVAKQEAGVFLASLGGGGTTEVPTPVADEPPAPSLGQPQLGTAPQPRVSIEQPNITFCTAAAFEAYVEKGVNVPDILVAFHSSGEVADQLASEGVGLAISACDAPRATPGLHYIGDPNDIVFVTRFKRIYASPSCVMQCWSDQDCLHHKVCDGRAWWGCAAVLRAYTWPATNLVLVEQSDTIVDVCFGLRAIAAMPLWRREAPSMAVGVADRLPWLLPELAHLRRLEQARVVRGPEVRRRRTQTLD